MKFRKKGRAKAARGGLKAFARPKPRAKGRGKAEAADDDAPISREIPGLILLSVALVTLIALISEYVQASGNILGPWLGSWWAVALNRALGGLPVLVHLVALVVLGIQWVFNRPGWRAVSIAATIGFLLSLLLSIQHLGVEGLTGFDYQSSGGWLGNFLAQRIFLPVFGPSHFGPYLVTGLLIFVLAVWGFQLSVAAWVKRSAHVAGVVGRTIAEGWRSAERAAVPSPDPEAALFDEAQEAPRAARKTRGQKANGKADETLIPTAADTPEEEQAKLEALLESGNLEGLDPLTIRKLRDLALERKRVTELNDWEEKTRDTEIGGLLGRMKKGAAPAAGAPEASDAPDSAAGKDPVPPGSPNGTKGRKASKGAPDVQAFAPDTALSGNAAAGFSGNAEGEGASGDGVLPPPVGFDEDGDGADFADAEAAPAPVKKPGKASTPRALALRNAAGGADAPDDEGLSEDPPQALYDVYRLPELDAIFPDPPVQMVEFTEEELREQKQLLEAQLNNFKVRGKVTGIHPGPVITRYEVELAPGEKVNRISGLSDDLALALRAKSIRILAPIPGKSLVGIEVPNRKAQMVYIKEILSSAEFAPEEDTLKIAVGKTIAGDPYVADLTRAPHLLIAGQTGSGKSVCINSIMASLLLSKAPDDLRMILIDPKVVELKPYEKIPHLLGPVITQPEVAVQALKWATLKMDERYAVLAQAGVRNIKGYNQKVREGTLPAGARYNQALEFGDAPAVREGDAVTTMPYVLIVIDELADLMMVAGKEVETNIARIAQKARAVGIHLILATQRPSTNVITGTIKANLPTRMAFQVASQIDARTILDRQGAEKLLGRGDMLYRPIEFPEPVRLHGCFLDDAQCEAVAGACADQFVNYPRVKSFNVEEALSGDDDGDADRDARFADAAELVVQLKQASVSLLQRRLGLGYARSGRLVDQLERAGIVGRERGSKPREVLMTEEELQSFLRSHEATEGL